MGAEGQIGQLQWPDRNSFKHADFMTDPGEHPANFPVAAFGKCNLQPTSVGSTLKEFGFGCLCQSLGDIDTFLKPTKFCGGGNTDDLDVILFLHPVPWVSQLVGQVTIIGNKDQAFTRLIEPPDVVNAFVGFDQVDDAGTSSGVFARRKDTRRFVEDEILKALDHQLLSIDIDLLLLRIDFRSKRHDDLAIDFDTAFFDD